MMTRAQILEGVVVLHKLTKQYGIVIQLLDHSFYILWESGKVETLPRSRRNQLFDHVLSFNPEILKGFEYQQLINVVQMIKMSLNYAPVLKDELKELLIRDNEKTIFHETMTKFKFMCK
jgi:hypothetical protein